MPYFHSPPSDTDRVGGGGVLDAYPHRFDFFKGDVLHVGTAHVSRMDE